MGIEISKSGRNRLRNVWTNMMERCYDPVAKSYPDYGGSGIKVCGEWRYSFAAFIAWAMENGYDEKAKRSECTLDRINPFGNYCPENCRWTNMEAQIHNQKVHTLHDENEDLIYKAEVAKLLGKSVRFVESRTACGVIPSMLIGSRRLYSKAVVEALKPRILKSKRIKPSNDVAKCKTGQGSANYRPWTETEEQIILHPNGKTILELAKEIGRSKDCIYARLRRLGTTWSAVSKSA